MDLTFGPDISENGSPVRPSGLSTYFPGGVQPADDDEFQDVLLPPESDGLDNAIGLLTAALMEDPAVRNDNLDLYNEAQALAARIKDRLTAQRDRRVSHLRSEADRLYEACRQALDKCRTLANDVNIAQMNINGIAQEVANARGELRAIETAKPAPGTYPTAAEKDQWITVVNAARQKAGAWEAKQNDAETRLTSLKGNLHRAEVEFRDLDAQHQDLLNRIARGAPGEQPLPAGTRRVIGLQGRQTL